MPTELDMTFTTTQMAVHQLKDSRSWPPVTALALGWATVLFTVTVPGWLLLVVLLAVWDVGYVVLARWIDRRWP